MSKIIISFWSKNGKVFYETLANSFCKNGNDVFYLDMSEYIDLAYPVYSGMPVYPGTPGV